MKKVLSGCSSSCSTAAFSFSPWTFSGPWARDSSFFCSSANNGRFLLDRFLSNIFIWGELYWLTDWLNDWLTDSPHSSSHGTPSMAVTHIPLRFKFGVRCSTFPKRHVGLTSEHVFNRKSPAPWKANMYAWVFLALVHPFTTLSLSSRLLSWRGDEGNFKFELRLHRVLDYTRMPAVLNSHTLPLKARQFCLERLLRGLEFSGDKRSVL